MIQNSLACDGKSIQLCIGITLCSQGTWWPGAPWLYQTQCCVCVEAPQSWLGVCAASEAEQPVSQLQAAGGAEESCGRLQTKGQTLWLLQTAAITEHRRRLSFF